MSRKKRKPEDIELVIDSIAFEGLSVARKEGLVYLVKGGVPGDKVIAQVQKKKKKYAEGKVLEVLEPSANRITPPCRYFGVCGGCSWQNINYSEQLFWKKTHVHDSCVRLNKVGVGEFRETMPSDNEYFYRNKMEFSFSSSRWLTNSEIENNEIIENKDFSLGLHIPGRFDKVLDIDKCLIQVPLANEVLSKVRSIALEYGVEANNEKEHKGFLRNLVIRSSHSTGELMLVLITREANEENEKNMVRRFFELFGKMDNIASAIHAVNNSMSPVAIGEIREVSGNDFITENILGIEYKISPFSFFQTNSLQLDKFISEIINAAELKDNYTVWDLYCGTGSITLPASSKVKEIIGIELVESSILDARANAQRNGITNAKFLCLDLHDRNIADTLKELPVPDVIIVDPPRAGMHKNLVEQILNFAPPTLVYVSCNPTTQGRDCELLSEKYEVEYVQPVDMFPQTFHVESIARLRRKIED